MLKTKIMISQLNQQQTKRIQEHSIKFVFINIIEFATFSVCVTTTTNGLYRVEGSYTFPTPT